MSQFTYYMPIFLPGMSPFLPQKSKLINCYENPPDYIFLICLKCISLNLSDVTVTSVLKFMYESKIIGVANQGEMFWTVNQETGQTLKQPQ